MSEKDTKEPGGKSAISYRDAGVDIEAGNDFVRQIAPLIKKTHRPEVIGGIGGFGALFNFDTSKYKNPVLVSATDGVGTKLKIAFLLNKHDTVGIDLVAMSVNDLIVCGAEPLFFLDYLSCGKLSSVAARDVVAGIAEGCAQAGCALTGGETAEMPSFYPDGEYDLAGFAVGAVDRDLAIDGSGINAGDALIGLASNGLHSNGYSLVRKLLLEGDSKVDLNEKVPGGERTYGEELLAPTQIYVKTILALIEKYEIKGIAHITGGGLIDNLPRILPKGCRAQFDAQNWPEPAIFGELRRRSGAEEFEMRRTFNLGIGMVLAVPASDTDGVIDLTRETGIAAYLIGEVKAGEQPGVDFI
jgi:phosphoribosylformylglycinamidine cyclo-ligase